MRKLNFKLGHRFRLATLLAMTMACVFWLTPARAEEATTTEFITVNVTIRHQDQILFNGVVNIPSTTLFNYQNNNEAATGTAGYTALAALISADLSSENFFVNKIDYYSSSGNYFINCLTLYDATESCNNWQYTINSSYPAVGADQYAIIGGEQIYFYYGDRHHITVPTTSYYIGETATGTIVEYDYQNNQYFPLPNVILGLLDTSGSALLATTSDALGEAVFSFSATGTFRIGMQNVSDWGIYYWPKSMDFIVLDAAPATTTLTSTPPTDTPGGHQVNPSNQIEQLNINFAVDKILNFLRSKQDADGKIIDGGTTDWAMMAFAVKGIYADEVKNTTTSLLDFAKTYNFTDASDLNICAAYPRHILALLAGGVDASNALIQNLKTKIETECYQNNLYGQTGINDDIFGLIALLAIGANPDQLIIQSAVNTILADQTAYGAFTWAGWPGADITGAAIDALKYAENKGVAIEQEKYSKAKNYLKSQQLADGGWGYDSADALTTSWVIMGISATGESQTDWFNSAGKNPWHPLTAQLKESGYYESAWAPGPDWFGTKHAVPALLGKSWPIILPPRVEIAPNNSGGSIFVPATTTPASTLPITIPTTTPMISTSTLITAIETTTTVTQISTTTNIEIPITKMPGRSDRDHDSTSGQSKNKSQIINTKITNLPTDIDFSIVSLPQNDNRNNLTNNLLNQLPLDTPTRRAAKKILAVSGGGTVALGLYLGLKLLRGVV